MLEDEEWQAAQEEVGGGDEKHHGEEEGGVDGGGHQASFLGGFQKQAWRCTIAPPCNLESPTRKFLQIVVPATAPVLGVSFSILVMRSAGVFPPALAWDGWADWVIMSTLVFTSTSFLYYLARRLEGDAGVQKG